MEKDTEVDGDDGMGEQRTRRKRGKLSKLKSMKLNCYKKLMNRLKKQEERQNEETAARGHSIEASTPNNSHEVEIKCVVLWHVVQRQFAEKRNTLALRAVSDHDRTTASFAAILHKPVIPPISWIVIILGVIEKT